MKNIINEIISENVKKCQNPQNIFLDVYFTQLEIAYYKLQTQLTNDDSSQMTENRCRGDSAGH